MGWGAAFLDADLDGRLDLFFANGHIFADVGDYPRARRDATAQKNQLLLNAGRRASATSRHGAGAACRSRGSAAGSPWATSTTTAIPTSS